MILVQLQLQLQLQLPLHYTTLYYNYNYNYTTPHYIQQLWVRWPLQPLHKAQPQPPFSPSVDSLCHPWVTTANLSYSFLSLKLPPPPCAVLLVTISSIRRAVFHGIATHSRKTMECLWVPLSRWLIAPVKYLEYPHQKKIYGMNYGWYSWIINHGTASWGPHILGYPFGG